MTVHAKVQFQGGAFIDADGSVLGAFKDGVCRGVQTIATGPSVKWFQLAVGSNLASESAITLKVYNAATDRVLEVQQQLTFAADTTVGSIAEPQTYTALPGAHTVTYLAAEHGSIVGPTPQTVLDGEDGTQVTAEPAACYHFERWSDGSTDNPRQDLDVRASLTVTVTFEISRCTVTFKPGEHGALAGGTPDVTVTVDCGAAAPTPPTVTPAENWAFTGWSPGLPVTITTNVEATAQYGENTGPAL